MSRAVGVGL